MKNRGQARRRGPYKVETGSRSEIPAARRRFWKVTPVSPSVRRGGSHTSQRTPHAVTSRKETAASTSRSKIRQLLVPYDELRVSYRWCIIMLPDLQTFIEKVDAVTPRLTKATSLEQARTLLFAPSESNLTRTSVTDKLRTEIQTAFSSGHSVVFYHCRELRKRLVHEYIANGASLDPYFEILSRLMDAMHGVNTENTVQGDWVIALRAAVEQREFAGDIHRPSFERLCQSDIERARAAIRLKGIQVNGRADRVPYGLSSDRDALIARSIAKRVTHMGGIDLARRIFQHLENTYCKEHGCYHDVNRFSPPGGQPFVPRLPSSLLFQLAAKYPAGRRPYKRADRDWEELREMSTDYATLHAVQPASNIEWWNKDPQVVLSSMRDIAIHDSLYTLPQLRPRDVPRILHGLLDSLVKLQKIPPRVAGQCRKLLCVVDGIQRAVGERRGPVVIQIADVQAACEGMGISEVRSLLSDALAHPAKGANSRYTRPTEIPDESLPRVERAGADFAERPLLLLGDERYLLLSHSACSPAFIEAFLAQLRVAGIDSDVGYAVEEFLRSELVSCGIDIKFGDYSVGGAEGECDIVIETDRRVIFVETKKKSLTRAARSGFDIAVLTDMVDGMLHATLQSGWHELHLRTHGRLTLKTPHSRQIVELRGRDVEHMAISLADYGGLQDRLVVKEVLRGQLLTQYASNSPEYAGKIAKVNEKVEELKRLNEQLYTLQGKPERWQPFFGCWFLSVPQFLLMLDDVKGAEGFAQELQRTRSFTLGSHDFSYEYCYAKRMAQSKS